MVVTTMSSNIENREIERRHQQYFNTSAITSAANGSFATNINSLYIIDSLRIIDVFK